MVEWQGKEEGVYVKISATEKIKHVRWLQIKIEDTETTVTKFLGYTHKIQKWQQEIKLSFALLQNNYPSPACVRDHRS